MPRRPCTTRPAGGRAALIALFLAAASAAPDSRAARVITQLPHAERFDTPAYASDLVWTSEGATHVHVATGGWLGGAARFTPPVTEQGYAGLGQFLLSGLATVPAQLNVRFLIYHGSSWNLHGPGNKLVILNRDGNPGRPMIITRHWNEGLPTQWETWGACDGTVCRYQGGDFWPDGTDALRIGDPPVGREHEWVSVELEADTATGMIRLYVDTRDGTLRDLYIQRPMDDTGPGGTWSYVDIIGGYMERATTVDAETYFLVDELVIDSRRIGPPAGFVQCCFADGFEGP